MDSFRDVIRRAEILLWPHEPGVEDDPAAASLLQKLRDALDNLPLETLPTPAELGRRLGARVVLAHVTHPIQGWTRFRREGSRYVPYLIEVADWLTPEQRQLSAAHEDCHAILGPFPKEHDRLTERVCNWGAGVIMSRIGAESTKNNK